MLTLGENKGEKKKRVEKQRMNKRIILYFWLPLTCAFELWPFHLFVGTNGEEKAREQA